VIKRNAGVVAALIFFLTSCNGAPSAYDLVDRVSVEIPSGQLGEQLNWVTEGMHNGVQQKDADTHFHETFLAELGPEEIKAVFLSLQERSPYTLQAIRAYGDMAITAAFTDKVGTNWEVYLSIDPTDGTINDLAFNVGDSKSKPFSTPQDWKEFKSQYAALAEKTSFLAARVANGHCKPIETLHPEQTVPAGQTFRLYVLHALVQAIETGAANWDDTLLIENTRESTPAGAAVEDPRGTAHELQTYAKKMISSSDSTATRYLVRHLGVARIEAIRRQMMAKIPADSTKTSPPVLPLKDLQKAPTDPENREIPPHTNQETKPESTPETSSENQEFGTDWPITVTALCEAHASLQQLALQEKLTPIRGILAGNPEIPLPPPFWTYTAFLSDTTDRSLTLSWYLEREDGTAFVIAGILENTQAKKVDKFTAFALMSAAVELFLQKA